LGHTTQLPYKLHLQPHEFLSRTQVVHSCHKPCTVTLGYALCVVLSRDDQYPVCWLDIWQETKFSLEKLLSRGNRIYR